MAIVVPTITAENPHQYREQIERVQGFTHHIHVDTMDGIFTPNKSLDPEQLWLPEDITCDIHVMYQQPETVLSELQKLSLRLVIVQAESGCDFEKMATQLKKDNIQFGVSLLAGSKLTDHINAVKLADHVLIFSGNLGHQGGSIADLSLLSKIDEIKSLNPGAEIGWDGGVNEQNIKSITDAGVGVVNVGGFVHRSPRPIDAYKELQQQIS